MPTYSYRCAECAHAFDIVQSFAEDSLTECPVCGGSLRKVFGAVGVSFKGSGFYRTDSTSSGPKAETKAAMSESQSSQASASSPTGGAGAASGAAAS